LLRRALEVIVGINLVLALIQQWIVPGIVNSIIPFSVSMFKFSMQQFMNLIIILMHQIPMKNLASGIIFLYQHISGHAY
jgi:hypothetical protein